MKYVNLGKTGLKVSRLSLGIMTYGSRQWREWLLEEEERKLLEEPYKPHPILGHC
ncbi:hypothetical protein [Scytonema hofmannii]|uniref:hypothetical protein n=1 Tax=Scytonema hofmannii TaxID=34078 RepID=UPI000349457D|nr:hypothetical protein [Scytonema hofmannii]